ncbi:tellurite resistance TerB family protein [Massilia pseudoviolaceinigra]|uniref:tellurite resistance TerB family protein n=1 Tax=Massilia pseudoviolaceinigra TaxID=3057165 RepID=UPI002796A665|nr:TerB family tellurite resistance protein [Massilia sp. CCM 9206]MDQ1924585.1 TerB family tellurite resistance protein [Massilia sp. CCM 9206]
MRRYETDSPQAAGRILALAMVVDGNLAQSELAALDSSKILQHIDLDRPGFKALLQELCQDMLTSAFHGEVRIDGAMLDGLLDEIRHPDLRRQLMQAMWRIADADGWLADAEAVLLARASTLWCAETNFSGRVPARA